VIYKIWDRSRNYIKQWLQSAPKQHTERINNVAIQVKKWIAQGCPTPLTTSRSGWSAMSELVPAYKKTHQPINMPMSDIIWVDFNRRIIRVEPFVNMGQITEFLNPQGWTLPVVPELDELTVGGLINGFGVESSSHKFGLFQFNVDAMEIITADGELRRCSTTENSELFYTIPWSHGTLGFLVAAELRIIPCKPYVELSYKPLHGLDNIVTEFEKVSRSEVQFVEFLLFGPEKGVLMTGDFAQKPDKGGRKNSIGNFWKPWFYKHVESYLQADQVGKEFIPLRHYYHRHTRSLFWEMEEIVPFGNHPLFRYTLGWAVPPPIKLLKYFETETTKNLREQYHVVQDMLIPISHLKKSLEYFEEHYMLYPLWLCPMSIFAYPGSVGLVNPFKSQDGNIDPLYVDIGAYGTPKKQGFYAPKALQDLEKFVLDHKGYQAMYARTMLSREDFRKMFNHEMYLKLRNQIPNTSKAFGEIYDKVGGKNRLSPADYKKFKKQTINNLVN